jgi:uncharacterized membrane protein YphA (DoxX/SURF4 family)
MEVKRTMSIVLWIIQALLALVFLLAGGMKLILPVAELTQQVPLPGVLIRVIGVIEVLGALGLILPGLFRIRIGLTYLAAAGLAVEMVVATVFALSVFGVTAVALPLVLALLSACVAYGRWKVAPLHVSDRAARTRPARSEHVPSH